jgi:hypothetical protein
VEPRDQLDALVLRTVALVLGEHDLPAAPRAAFTNLAKERVAKMLDNLETEVPHVEEPE